MDLDRAHRRQVLVGRGGEVVPDVVFERIGGQRAARVGLQQGHRHAQLGGQEVVVAEIGLLHDFAHRRLELLGLGPLPVVVPALQVVRPDAARSGKKSV